MCLILVVEICSSSGSEVHSPVGLTNVHMQLSTPFNRIDQINRSEIIKHNANSLVK